MDYKLEKNYMKREMRYLLESEIMRTIRLDKGLTQQALCTDICSQSTYASFEKQGYSISSDRLFKLLNRLNVHLDEFEMLLNGKENIKKMLTRNLEKAIQGKDATALQTLATEFYQHYELEKDIFYLCYYLKSLEFFSKLTTYFDFKCFSYEQRQVVTTLKEYLKNVEHWRYFECALFSNLIMYLDSSSIMNFIKALPNKVDLELPKNQELFIKAVVNSCASLIESEEYPLLLATLQLTEEYTTDLERLHWRIVCQFFKDICEEIVKGKRNKGQYQYLKIYSTTEHDGYYQTLMNFRQRILKEKCK